MSNADKTREMLMNSMMKTKATADAKTSAGKDKPTSASNKGTVVRKTTSRKKSTSPKVASKGASSATGAQRNTPQDPYQSRGRVWPD